MQLCKSSDEEGQRLTWQAILNYIGFFLAETFFLYIVQLCPTLLRGACSDLNRMRINLTVGRELFPKVYPLPSPAAQPEKRK